MATRITTRDLSGMLTHWLSTPPNGYLGSGYGSDVKSLLQTPMASGLADGLIAKARQDVPLLLTAPPDAVNIYKDNLDMDRMGLFFVVSGEVVPIDGGQSMAQQDTAPVIPTEPTQAEINLSAVTNRPKSGAGYF